MTEITTSIAIFSYALSFTHITKHYNTPNDLYN